MSGSDTSNSDDTFQLSINSAVSAPIDAMDPRLQLLVAMKRSGAQVGLGVSTAENEIAVIARVDDLRAWENLSEVRVGTSIPSSDNSDYIVSARIPIQRVEFVRKQPFVQSLKAAKNLQPVLHATVEETQARSTDMPTDASSNGGEGVVVGIIDYACDFAHQNFRKPGGETRIEAIWDQRGNSGSRPTDFDYGREISSTEINAALTSGSPYTSLGYAPPVPGPNQPSSHGTHVMDIAAGNGHGTGVAGVAPQADLIFVDISHADLPFGDSQVVGSTFGDSTRLLEAVKYIFAKAGDRPCVVNISLGTNGGPHDGTTLVEDGIDRLLNQAPNRAVCIAASNSFADGIHAAGNVTQDNFVDLRWQVSANDSSANEFELWYSSADRFDVELIAPNGHSFGRVNPGPPLSLTNPSGNLVAFVANRLNDPNNGDNTIGIFLERRLPSWDPTGIWTVRIHGDEVTAGDFHAWIERDNAVPSSFAPPHDNTHTLGSISCGQKTIVVGSYDAHKTTRPVSWFSSAGPTRDGRQKPEISAPGHAVDAAESRSFNGATIKSGTSMASPAVAGICALAYDEANRRNIDLSIDELRDMVESSARRNPPSGSSWNDRFGHGRIDASEIVQAVIDMDDGGGGTSAARKSSKSASRTKKSKKVSTKKKATRKKKAKASKKKKVGKKKTTKKKPTKKKKSRSKKKTGR